MCCHQYCKSKTFCRVWGLHQKNLMAFLLVHAEYSRTLLAQLVDHFDGNPMVAGGGH